MHTSFRKGSVYEKSEHLVNDDVIFVLALIPDERGPKFSPWNHSRWKISLTFALVLECSIQVSCFNGFTLGHF
jgi:hypothetical protein